MGWPNNKSPDIRAFLLVSRETLTDVESGVGEWPSWTLPDIAGRKQFDSPSLLIALD